MRLDLIAYAACLVVAVVAVVVVPQIGRVAARRVGLIGLLVLLATSWNLLAGFAGRVSFGHAAFFGVGAVVTAGMMSAFGTSAAVAVVAASLLAALLSIPASLTLRSEGAYFAIATLAFAELTRLGTSRIFPATLRGVRIPVESVPVVNSVTVGVVVATAVLTAGLVAFQRSTVGRTLLAVRDSQLTAEGLGVPTVRYLSSTFVMSAAVAGLAGAFYALFVRIVGSADVFSIVWSIEPALATILGGIGTITGPIVGGVIWHYVAEWTRRIANNAAGVPIAQGSVILLVFLGLRSGLVTYVRRRWGAPRRLRPPSSDGEPSVETAPGASIDEPRGRASGPPLLEVHDISVYYGGFEAVREVSLTVGEGEIVSLIGPNGAGKSTLLGAVAGYRRAATGRILMAGVDLTGRRTWSRARAGLALVPQHPHPFASLTLPEMRRIVERQRRFLGRRAESSRGQGHVRDLSGFVPHDVPAGEMPETSARLASLDLVVRLGAPLLLLDEVAAGLDTEEEQVVRRVLTDLRAQRRGVLLVEHNMDLVMSVSDRVVVLDQGRVIAAGSPDEVQADPSVIRAYLGGDDAVEEFGGIG